MTGASSGIGEATVRALAVEGFETVVAARRLERCERLAAEVGGRTVGPGRWACSTRSTSLGIRRPATPTFPNGSSFIAAISFRGRGCPVKALTFVTYGQSENQSSPHAAD